MCAAATPSDSTTESVAGGDPSQRLLPALSRSGGQSQERSVDSTPFGALSASRVTLVTARRSVNPSPQVGQLREQSGLHPTARNSCPRSVRRNGTVRLHSSAMPTPRPSPELHRSHCVRAGHGINRRTACQPTRVPYYGPCRLTNRHASYRVVLRCGRLPPRELIRAARATFRVRTRRRAYLATRMGIIMWRWSGACSKHTASHRVTARMNGTPSAPSGFAP